MTKSELTALLYAHNALVEVYADPDLTLAEFVSAYGDFPHNYALHGRSETPGELEKSIVGPTIADLPYCVLSVCKT